MDSFGEFLEKIHRGEDVTNLACIELLQDYGVLSRYHICEEHQVDMEMAPTSQPRFKDGFVFSCPTKGCRQLKSVRVDSILFKKKTSLQEFLRLLIEFSLKSSVVRIVSAKITCYSRQNSICGFNREFRRALIFYITAVRSQHKLGGPGCIVEIDEILVGGRTKYNKGRYRPNSQQWAFGAVDIQTKEFRYVLIKNRSRSELEPIIRSLIAPGSIIHSDEWSAYKFLDRDPQFSHFTVNHSKCFKSSSGIHTNNIEGINSHLRKATGARNLTRHDRLDEYLAEFQSRPNSSLSCWIEFTDILLKALGIYSYYNY